MRVKIDLETLTDVKSFVDIAQKHKGNITLCDNEGHVVCGKSFLGVCYSLEFEEVWCNSEEDIYHEIERWTVDE